MNIDSLRLLLRMSGFFLATDTPERGEREQRQMLKSLAETSGRIDVITKLFYGNTKTLIAEEPCKLVGDERSTLDVVKDVFRVVPSSGFTTQVVRQSNLVAWFLQLTENPFSSIGWHCPQETGRWRRKDFHRDALNTVYAFYFLDIGHIEGDTR